MEKACAASRKWSEKFLAGCEKLGLNPKSHVSGCGKHEFSKELKSEMRSLADNTAKSHAGGYRTAQVTVAVEMEIEYDPSYPGTLDTLTAAAVKEVPVRLFGAGVDRGAYSMRRVKTHLIPDPQADADELLRLRGELKGAWDVINALHAGTMDQRESLSRAFEWLQRNAGTAKDQTPPPDPA